MWKSPVHVVVVGTSFKVAPIDVRESLSRSFASTSLKSFLNGGVGDEAFAVLSTCNRLEVYTSTNDLNSTKAGIERYFFRLDERSRGKLFYLVDSEAVQHLFSVACGLDSLVVGEPQILLQIRHAGKIRGVGTSQEVIEKLFHRAYSAGKRIRKEAGIEPDSSVSSLALQLIKSKLGPKPNLLFVGAGKMIRAAITAMSEDEFGEVYIANRSPSGAKIQSSGRIQVHSLQSILGLLPRIEGVVVATSSPTYIVTKEMLEGVMPDKRVVFVDVSVPRNVDPKISELANIEVYYIDDLVPYARRPLNDVKVTRIKQIIDDEVARFVAWLSALEISPVLKAIRTQAESMRREELAEALRRLSGVREKDAKVLSVLSSRIVNRLLYEPTVRLRELAKNGTAKEYSRVLRELLGIDD